MTDSAAVFDAVRRGYTDLGESAPAEIEAYFEGMSDTSIIGHKSHIKGILFEQQYVQHLQDQGLDASIFEVTNHPVSDIAIREGGVIISELQLKATDSASYVAGAIEDSPEVGFVVTSEVAAALGSELVVDSGISEESLEEAVSSTLFDEVVNPISPFSILRWLVGLPF